MSVCFDSMQDLFGTDLWYEKAWPDDPVVSLLFKGTKPGRVREARRTKEDGGNGWGLGGNTFFVVSTITYRGRICTQCRPKALYFHYFFFCLMRVHFLYG